jgi:hypothetical protein
LEISKVERVKVRCIPFEVSKVVYALSRMVFD